MHFRAPSRRQDVGGWVLRVVVAAGLAGDAAVHLNLAGNYGGGELLGIENLFLGAAGLAALAGVLVLVVRRAWTALVAFAVAAGTLAAVVTSRYVDLGTIGPLPDLYEPVWYPLKVVSVVAEAVAVVAAVVLLVRQRSQPRSVSGTRRAQAPRPGRSAPSSRQPSPRR